MEVHGVTMYFNIQIEKVDEVDVYEMYVDKVNLENSLSQNLTLKDV